MKMALRKFRSALVHASMRARSIWVRAIAHHMQDGISIGKRVQFGAHTCLSATDTGAVSIGDRVSIGRMSQIVAREGKIHIADDVFLGDGCVLVSLDSIEIGAGTQIAEYVVVRDQDHRLGAGPVRHSGFDTAPIVIGRDCWLGAKVTVLRGARIGDGAVIGAHSLVRGDVPPGALAVGSPARVVRILTKRDRQKRGENTAAAMAEGSVSNATGHHSSASC
jgi:acetyltransferase-like isoleucine patch superfamily enzyme